MKRESEAAAEADKEVLENGEGEVDDEEILEIEPLGAGNEVGRSCVVLRYKGKRVMLDCGIHPGYSGLASLPFFDTVDMATIDAILVTHFHLDHCAAVPYVVGNTTFKGRILMTHPTKSVYKTLLSDFVKLAKNSDTVPLFTEKDLEASMEKIEVVDFHQQLELDGIRVTPFMAGHVLGAAMFLVEIGGVRVLYTGDYSRRSDRHLAGAELPDTPPHVVIVESTYGIQTHAPREQREKRFCNMVRTIIQRGGRVLLPVVALGRAQELLLILEEYWSRHPELHKVPIYQASGLARRSMSIYQTFINMMNDDIRTAFELRNPFVFKYIQHITSANAFDDVGPCVVMATPSMIQSGLSRDLFEAWCEDPRNGVIIADFAVQGTMAREVLSSPTEITSRDGHKLALRMTVDAISFSAHADLPQTREFLDTLRPQHVVLVHGEATEMFRLRKALEQHATQHQFSMEVLTPKNCQKLRLPFRFDKIARVAGSLATREGKRIGVGNTTPIGGILIRKGFSHIVVGKEDLGQVTNLSATRISQKLSIPTSKTFSEVRFSLEQVFMGVNVMNIRKIKEEPSESGEEEETKKSDDDYTLALGQFCRLSWGGTGEKGTDAPHVILEWASDPVNDMIADSVISIILQLEEDESLHANSIKRPEEKVPEAVPKAIVAALNGTFGSEALEIVEEGKSVIVKEGDNQCVVSGPEATTHCEDQVLNFKVQGIIESIMESIRPIDLALTEADIDDPALMI